MEAAIFDLDNTLYSSERELFSLIDVRINHYMSEIAGIPTEEVDQLRRLYWEKYGVTLQGLIRHHGVDPEDYLHYVHDVDVSSRLGLDEELRTSLQELPMRRAVFTNGSRGHAESVLSTLGIEDLFEEIFDIRVAAYLPKPFEDPYRKVLKHLDLPGHKCVMIEDSLPNLKTAKELGMGTILVGGASEEPFVDMRVGTATEASRALKYWS